MPMLKTTEKAYNKTEVNYMYNTTVNNAKTNFETLINMTLESGEAVNVVTDNGNAIMLSEFDYRSLLLNLEVEANPNFKRSLLNAMSAPDSEFVDESEVEW